MGSLSVWHFLVLIFWIAGIFVPMAQIIHNAGYSRFWILLGFIPLVNIVSLWIFAFSRWPARSVPNALA